MKIGILAQYLETRPDIRELIGLLARDHAVVIYRQAGAGANADLPSGVEIRTFRKRSSLKIKLWHFLFKAFGRVPRSRHNYFITEDFKIQNSGWYGANLKTWQARALLWINYTLPGWLSYDAYTAAITESVEARIDDVDRFLCYTQIYDDGFLGNILAAQKPVNVLVYSWDHPCKMKCFSQSAQIRYLVWNPNIARDLVELQGIAPNKIHTIGTSQFGYLHRFIASGKPKQEMPWPYVYFAFSTGTLSLALQEIRIMKQLAASLAEVWPEAKLVIRPYPFFKGKGVYDELENLPNVVREPEYTGPDSVQEKMNHKYRWMGGSAGFFHFGTTLGVEACFLDCPVFFLSLKEENLEKGLYYFIHQYQNDAYLHRPGSPNTLESLAALRSVLQGLALGGDYQNYNAAVREAFTCESFEAYTRRVLAEF